MQSFNEAKLYPSLKHINSKKNSQSHHEALTHFLPTYLHETLNLNFIQQQISLLLQEVQTLTYTATKLLVTSTSTKTFSVPS